MAMPTCSWWGPMVSKHRQARKLKQAASQLACHNQRAVVLCGTPQQQQAGSRTRRVQHHAPSLVYKQIASLLLSGVRRLWKSVRHISTFRGIRQQQGTASGCSFY